MLGSKEQMRLLLLTNLLADGHYNQSGFLDFPVLRNFNLSSLGMESEVVWEFKPIVGTMKLTQVNKDSTHIRSGFNFSVIWNLWGEGTIICLSSSDSS